jgi:dipeptidyl aminopeptidase/acylaminoacyl peptidase
VVRHPDVSPNVDEGRVMFRRGGRAVLPYASLLLFAMGSASASAESHSALRPVGIEDLLAVRIPHDLQISPDGIHVAFVVFEPPSAREAPQPPTSNIWIVDTQGRSEPRRLTSGPGMDWSPQWAPDSRRLAFLSTRSGSTQLYVLDAAGGEPRAVTPPDLDLTDVSWSPDGSVLAFLTEDGTPSDYGTYGDSAFDEMIISRTTRPSRLNVLDPGSGALRQLTEPGASVICYDWSPDAKEFAVVLKDPQVDGGAGTERSLQLARMSAGGGQLRRLAMLQVANVTAVRWAPNGTHLAVLAHDGRSPHRIMRTILLASAADGDPPRNLLADYRGSVNWFTWLPDGRRIAFNGLEGVHAQPMVLEVGGATLSHVLGGNAVTDNVSLDRRGTRFAFTDQSTFRPRDIWTADLEGRSRQLTHFNPELEQVTFGNGEIVHWRAEDGQEIEGILLRPPGGDPGRRYPTVVMPHGGSTGWSMWKAGFLTDVGQVMAAAHGYVVLYPNPRGTPGYGREFEEAAVGDVGGREFRDIMSGIDWLVARRIADPDRLGIGGWSGGGTMAAWAVTQTDRFRCAIDGGGIVNWESFYGQTDTPSVAIASFGGSPSERPALYHARSPLSHLDRVHTPLLVLHGEGDTHVPVGQAWEIYRGLKSGGKEVEFVLYPREQHFLMEPKHALNFMNRVLGWYETHLKAAEPARAAAVP